MSGATVRRLEPPDLAAVLEIESAALPWGAQWTPDSYLPFSQPEMCAWVAERTGQVAGFVLARYAGPEMEVLNLAVAEAARRTGVGRALVRAALAEGETRGATQVFLEVRESNSGALSFYAALGFSMLSRRKGYYQTPDEDALVLSLPLPRRG
ncbi:MAG TPA: ribosomal protein S18-alanine N-acetyltransferase [Candidatus Acidoferrales bacterium]|nr:ribosomal protein S18-alanine N-acetyltransferase [Candidatus Acidoferrales bacterium]